MDVPRLTPRERQVAAAVALGKTNRAIALDLGLSDRTVEHYVGAILDKHCFVSRSEIIAAAFAGHLDLPDAQSAAVAV